MKSYKEAKTEKALFEKDFKAFDSTLTKALTELQEIQQQYSKEVLLRRIFADRGNYSYDTSLAKIINRTSEHKAAATRVLMIQDPALAAKTLNKLASWDAYDILSGMIEMGGSAQAARILPEMQPLKASEVLQSFQRAKRTDFLQQAFIEMHANGQTAAAEKLLMYTSWKHENTDALISFLTDPEQGLGLEGVIAKALGNAASAAFNETVADFVTLAKKGDYKAITRQLNTVAKNHPGLANRMDRAFRDTDPE